MMHCSSQVTDPINSGLSVSRIEAAQHLIKKLGGKSRITLAQYRELAAFAQFSSDLDETTQQQLHAGVVLTEIFKQHQYQPLSVAQMGATLMANDLGLLQAVPLSELREYENELHQYLDQQAPTLVAELNETGKFDESTKNELTELLTGFHQASRWSDHG